MDKLDLFNDLKQLSLKTSSATNSETFVFDAGSDPQTILDGLLELAGKQFSDIDHDMLRSFITLAFKTGRLEGYTAGVEAHINDAPAIIFYPSDQTEYEKFGEALMEAVHQYAPDCLVGTNISIDGKSIPNIPTQDAPKEN
ncbi:MAG: hypothetical protein H6Q74_2892 [Firmicutes bacterium]|nr:hypothetical protein [Bacillota bacterium]